MNKLVATAALLFPITAPAFAAGLHLPVPPPSVIILGELPKCVYGVGVPGGCVGPNGEIIKFGRNALHDLTQGPGDHNDLFGREGWLRRGLGF
jgi:hypothetical protein